MPKIIKCVLGLGVVCIIAGLVVAFWKQPESLVTTGKVLLDMPVGMVRDLDIIEEQGGHIKARMDSSDYWDAPAGAIYIVDKYGKLSILDPSHKVVIKKLQSLYGSERPLLVEYDANDKKSRMVMSEESYGRRVYAYRSYHVTTIDSFQFHCTKRVKGNDKVLWKVKSMQAHHQ